MENVSCRSCGALLMEDDQKTGFCKSCVMSERRDYHLVREYLERYPNASIMDVVNHTKVPLRTVNRMIEDDKFIVK